MVSFSVTHGDDSSAARAAVFEVPHGEVETPAFMPVGTAGTVKGVAGWELERLAPAMILANTYHLMLRPGVEVVEELGGLHGFTGWEGPILTDSGGYQVFSLSEKVRLDEGGVTFASHLDGSAHRLTPESAVELQARFGVDVAMVLDECLPYPVTREVAGPSVRRSVRWAERALKEAERRRAGGWTGALFAIQQGSVFEDLRHECTEALVGRPFDGFAIGGLAVGEPTDVLHGAIAASAPLLPKDRPRYLMGVGYPEDMLHAIDRGVDLFDCVLPTRSARTGKVFTSQGDLVIKNARFRNDPEPLDAACPCPTCRRYSRGALRHYFVSKEATSVVLLTVHNLWYFVGLIRGAREAIMAGRWPEYRDAVLEARADPHPKEGF